jgi:hypothetical protein
MTHEMMVLVNALATSTWKTNTLFFFNNKKHYSTKIWDFVRIKDYVNDYTQKD